MSCHSVVVEKESVIDTKYIYVTKSKTNTPQGDFCIYLLRRHLTDDEGYERRAAALADVSIDATHLSSPDRNLNPRTRFANIVIIIIIAVVIVVVVIASHIFSDKHASDTHHILNEVMQEYVKLGQVHGQEQRRRDCGRSRDVVPAVVPLIVALPAGHATVKPRKGTEQGQHHLSRQNAVPRVRERVLASKDKDETQCTADERIEQQILGLFRAVEHGRRNGRTHLQDAADHLIAAERKDRR